MAHEAAFVRVFDGDPDKGGIFKGTAFFIRPQQLLTARHVVDACSSGVFLRIPPHGEACIIPTDRITRCQRDIASLYLHKTCDHAQLTPLAHIPPQLRDNVTLCGFFHTAQSLETRDTHISGYVNTQHTWRVADGVKPGMSGGAVIRAGELVGIIQARDEESKIIAYVIPVDAIRECLGELPETASDNLADTTELTRAEQVFVGRQDELAQLRQSLLGTAHTPVAITALHGMAGVGKSWLADHFYATHRHAFPGGYQRLTLNADTPTPADLLLAELADRLELSAPLPQLPKLVSLRLQQPRTLVHIENVDSDAAAAVAAQLCAKLPGCAIVLSGRLDNFGKARRWQQVGIRPFQTDEALAQLRAELAWLNAPNPPQYEAERLVQVLGGLPLAIHLAAGYLAAGYDVSAFLHELHATGFDLPPEDATDGLYNRDQARAVLHSTFQISLRELAQQGGKRGLAQADATFMQLGFAPGVGFGLSMAMAMLELDHGTGQSLLRLAQKLSLIDLTQTEPLRWQVHPLLADYLRQHATDPGGQERLHHWFLQRLPEPQADEEQSADYSGWHELNAEHATLGEWLATLPEAWQVTAERAGSQYAMRNGPFAHWMAFCQRALQVSTLEDTQRSNLLFTLAYVAHSAGDINQALQTAETKYQLDSQRGEEREATLAKGQIADILQARGQLDEALRIRTEDQLPVYERLGEVRSIAITKGKIADILQARGQLDEALRIRTEDQLPVYERLGEVREIAITKGKIADILFLNDQKEDAIKLFEDEFLPLLEYLGDEYTLVSAHVSLAVKYLMISQNIGRANQLLCSALQAAQQMQIPEAGQIAAILQHFGMTCEH